ncbi:MAG TPA: hypothetical protein VGN83_15815 [Falsiroseomonas sp.]|nr:hypothetical protein [Falsiroseomonas sp.]
MVKFERERNAPIVAGDGLLAKLLCDNELELARRRTAEAEARLVEQEEILRALESDRHLEVAVIVRRRFTATQLLLAQIRAHLEVLERQRGCVETPKGQPLLTVSRRREDQRP